MNQRDIGEALDRLEADVRDHVRELTRQYRELGIEGVLKQAVDTPHRARAQVAAWIADYNARNGGGAQAFLGECLVAAGSSKTLAQVDAALAALESAALTVVDEVSNNGWTWDQVATWIEAQISPTPSEELDYSRLPIPPGYVTVWGEPW